MKEIATATKDESMDLDSLINLNDGYEEDTKKPKKTTKKEKLSPVDEMAAMKGKGLAIDPTENQEEQVRSGQLRDETLDGVRKTLDDMDEMIEKAQLVTAEKPKTAVEMAATMEALSSMDVEEVRAAKNAAASEDLLEENGGSAVGIDLSAESALAVEGKGTLAGGLFRVKGDTSSSEEESDVDPDEAAKLEAREKTLQLLIDKTGFGPNLQFSKEEMDKMTLSTQIDIVQVEKAELKFAKVKTPDDGFMGQIRTDLHSTLGATSEIPLIGSRIRVTFRGLTYGEYANLALSQEITNVEMFNSRCNTYYNALRSTSIGMFTSYDEFLKNVAAIDMPMMTFGVYIATNPENMDVGIQCQVKECGNSFRHAFVPRTLLALEDVSDRFLEIMEKTSTVELGLPAKEYHEESSLVTRTRIVLPQSGIKVDLGLISCYDMIHSRLPYVADAEKILAEKYPEDIANMHALLPTIADTVADIIIPVNGEDIMIDDIVAMADILYNVPFEDYEVLMAITTQTNQDYSYGFIVRNVKCPKCGTETPSVGIAIDDEIFTQLQARRSITVNPKTLPRL